MNNENVYHIWPDDTICRPEDLEEYLTFMSDDYISVVAPEGFDESDIPAYSIIAMGNLRQLWGLDK